MISNVEFATVTWPTVFLVFVIFAVFCIGAFLGYFNSNVDLKKKLEQAQSRADAAIEQARGEAERAAARIEQAERRGAFAPAVVQAPPGKTLLRLWLDEKERPGLDLDGQQVDTAQLSDYNRKRIISLVTVMRPWIEGKPSASIPVPAPQPVISQPVAAQPTISTPITQTPPTAPKSIFSSLPTPSLLPGKKDEPTAAPRSMVAQIDEILQARLAVGPLADRGIKLQESPQGTVDVYVGAEKFEGVGDVTDPQIQSEIRAAIAAWEKKYTPGM